MQNLKIDVIPINLFKQQKYHKIIELIAQQAHITHYDRYIYAHSLLKLNQPLKALLNLWPLIKYEPELVKDCKLIGIELLQDPELLTKVGEDLELMYIIIQATKEDFCKVRVWIELQQKLFNLLWQHKEYEKLENLLKADKSIKDGVWLENISKVNFWQYEYKLPGNLKGFIGYTLTGAGCLILRDKFYHNDIYRVIQSLVKEIKKFFYDLKDVSKYKLSNLDLIYAFIDYEAQILIKVLNLAISQDFPLDFVGTPSYFINYKANLLLEKFVKWLKAKDPDLLKCYEVETDKAITWMLLNVDLKAKDLKLITSKNLDLEILLGLELKLAIVDSISWKNLVNIKDIVKLNPGLFKELLIKIIKLIINNFTTTARFWQMVEVLVPLLLDPELTAILVNKLIKDVKEGNLDLSGLKDLSEKLDLTLLNRELADLELRQQACREFLAKIKITSGSKKLINNILNQEDLYAHFRLIVDLKTLIPKELSSCVLDVGKHMNNLIHNKKINKMNKLNFYIDQFGSLHIDEGEIDHLFDHGGEIKLTHISYVKSKEQVMVEPFILQREDPFIALEVSLGDPKTIIMQKILSKIKESPQALAKLRMLQHELFDPGKRFVHHYFRYLSYHTPINTISSKVVVSASIPFREKFLNAR